MDTASINNGAANATAENPSQREQTSVSEQLQLLSLYLYLDARRYGNAQ